MKLEVPVAIAADLAALIGDYAKLVDADASGAVEELTVNAVLVQGIRWMRDAFEQEANRRFAFRNGWPLADENYDERGL